MLRKRLGLVAATMALVTILLAGGSSEAAIGPILAGPGSAASTYYTPVVVSRPGQGALFRNLDIALHDVRSTTGLFSSALIGLGKQTPVIGVDKLKPGVYQFFCSIHPNMKGRLIVR